MPADRNGVEQIQALLNDKTPEGRTLDYKRDLPLSSGDAKKEFARDAVSLANASGGFLIYGIVEKDKVPIEVCGVECPSFDKVTQSLEQLLRDHVQPRLLGVTFGRVDGGFPTGPVIVVHVPESWIGPHMATDRFYSRNSVGKLLLDVQQIRSAFIAGTEVGARIRRFRDDRLGKILANEGAMPLSGQGPTLVTHLHPLVDSADVFDGVAGRPEKLPPASQGISSNSRFSLDGYVTFPSVKPDQNEVYCYTLAFRNGAFERCEPMGIRADFTPHQGYGNVLEREILTAARLFVRLSREHGNLGPLTFMSALLQVRGIRIALNDDQRFGFQRRDAIDRTVVNLPEVIVEGQAITAEDLKPAFDALWQSSGWPRSPNFGADGKWKPPSD